jgi:hypothetical protein
MAAPLYVPATAPSLPPGTLFGRLVIRSNDADVPLVPGAAEDVYIFLRNLSAQRTVTLPAAPTVGQIVVVKDEDGSLAAFDIVIAGNGNTIDGAASYTMTLAKDGLKGAVQLVWQGAGWSIT